MFRSIGRPIEMVFAHSYQLDWVPLSCPVLPPACIPSLEAQLFYRGSPSVSASRFCFQTRSTRSSFACITGTDHHLRSRSVSSWSFPVRTFVYSFLLSRSSIRFVRSFVRSFGSRSFACSVCYTTKACSPGHTTIRLLYTSYTATNTVVSPTSHDHQSSRIANTTTHRFPAQFRPARCTAEIISTAAFTEPDSACLMLELRFAEIGKFNDAAAATSAHRWHP